jgi:MFS family permease
LGGSLWLVGLALFPLPAVLLPAAFVTGVAMEQFGVAWEVSLQEHVPADKLARVYSYDALGSFLAIPIGQVAAGPIADHVGARAALLGCGRADRCRGRGNAAQHRRTDAEHTVTKPPADETVPV